MLDICQRGGNERQRFMPRFPSHYHRCHKYFSTQRAPQVTTLHLLAQLPPIINHAPALRARRGLRIKHAPSNPTSCEFQATAGTYHPNGSLAYLRCVLY
jgi:hypothetical protein